jgi:hypothetical protein
MRIESKSEFYRLYHAGTLGNRPWQRHYTEYDPDDSPSLVALRHTQIAGWPLMRYDMRPRELVGWAESLFRDKKATPDVVQVSECMPDHRITLQGEVMRSANYYDLMYNTTPGLRMRQALLPETVRHAKGLYAKSLLDSHFDPSGRAWLDTLFDVYPDSVIEFATYSVPVGVEGQNHIIWEVRNY